LISISPRLYDLQGGIIAKRQSDTNTDTVSRRVSRVATLDGGANFFDNGFSDADRDFSVVLHTPSAADVERAKEIVRNFSEVTVSTEEGCFLGTITRGAPSQANFTLSIFIKARLSD
jgi:hypothetical protein